MKFYLGIGQGAVRDRAEAELAPARREDPQVCQDDREADVGFRDPAEAASVCQVRKTPNYCYIAIAIIVY